MMLDYLKLALNNLLHRRLRSWLTLVGIFIGIMAVVALYSLGRGMEEAVTAEFLALGADKMQITAKTPMGTIVDVDALKSALRDRDLRAVEQTRGVFHVVTFQQRTGKLTWGKDDVAFYSVIGAGASEENRNVFEDYFTLKLGEGRRLKESDTSKAMIGYELTNPDTLDNPLKIGDKITVNTTVFEVVGVYQKMGDPFVDTGFYVTDDAFKKLFSTKNAYDAFIVQVHPDADTEVVAQEIRQVLRYERNLKEGEEDFDVQTPRDIVDSFNVVFGIIKFAIMGIAFISLFIGGLGIMNTMYTAVLERTHEIGVMKAIGATNKTIMTIFLVESGLLGMVGGAIGVLTGLGLANFMSYLGGVLWNTTLLSAWFSWWLVFFALLFSFIAGVIAGVFPAYHASKQKPVDTLRYE